MSIRQSWPLLLALGLMGAACGPAPAATPTAASPVPSRTASPTSIPASTSTPDQASSLQGHVSIWTSWEAADTAVLADLLDSFASQYPRVEVSITYFRPEELRPAFEEATRSATGPTILIGPSEWGPALLRSKLIVDVGPRLLPQLQTRIPSLFWSQVTDGGSLLGVPLRVRGVVLYRNRNLVPQPAATFQDLLSAAAKVSVRYPSEPVFDLGFRFAGAQLTPCGGTLLRAGGGLAIDQTAGVCWLTLLRRFRQAGALTFNTDADRTTFMAGHSPWLIDSTAAMPDLASAIGSANLAVDAWPTDSETGRPLSGYVWTDNAYLAAGGSTLDQDASWALVNLLLAPDSQSRWTQDRESTFLPVVSDVQPTDELRAQALAVLASATALPLAPNLAVYTVPLDRAILSVAGQTADPAEALAHAAELIRNELSQSPSGG